MARRSREQVGPGSYPVLGPQPHPSFIEVFGEAARRLRPMGQVAGAGEDGAGTLIAQD